MTKVHYDQCILLFILVSWKLLNFYSKFISESLLRLSFLLLGGLKSGCHSWITKQEFGAREIDIRSKETGANHYHEVPLNLNILIALQIQSHSAF